MTDSPRIGSLNGPSAADAASPGRRINDSLFQPRAGRRLTRTGLRTVCRAAWLIIMLCFVGLVGVLIIQCRPWWDGVSRSTPGAALAAAAWGSIQLVALTSVIAVPLGMGAAIFLNEYAPGGRLDRWRQRILSHALVIPSVVYGVVGLAIFVHGLGLGRGVLSAALVLSGLTAPQVWSSTRRALRGVPRASREAAYGLGATRRQVVFEQVWPVCRPEVAAGVIRALARAAGEVAPLLVLIGYAEGVSRPAPPIGSVDEAPWTALPLRIFQATASSDPTTRDQAGPLILALLAGLFLMNVLALGIRLWHRKTVTNPLPGDVASARLDLDDRPR